MTVQSASPSLLRLIALLACLSVSTGCMVNASKDYDRTAQLIATRTAVTQPYQPDAEELVASRVDALLAGGLTAEEAVELTLLNNPGFQSLFEEVGISRAEVVQAGLMRNPVITGLVKFAEGGGRPSIDFGISQEIMDLWQIPIRRKIAKARLEQTIAAVANRAVDLSAQARTAYYRARARQFEEQTLSSSVKLVEESLAIVERQVTSGAASRLDLNLAEAASMDVRLDLIAVRRQRESAEIELGRMLGLPPNRYPKQLLDPLPASEPSSDTQRLLEFAVRERLDLRRAEQNLSAAEGELMRQSLLIFPSVIVGLGMERPERQSLPGRNVLADTARSSIRNGGLTAPDIQSRAERDLQRRQIIDFLIGPSFQMTVPLFDQNQAQVAIAANRVRQRRKDFQELLILAQSEIEQSLSALRTAREQFEFYRQQAIPIAEANEAGSRNVFKAGAQSILVLLQSQQSLINRRRALVVAQGDYATAYVELERVLGGRLPPGDVATTQPTGDVK